MTRNSFQNTTHHSEASSRTQHHTTKQTSKERDAQSETIDKKNEYHTIQEIIEPPRKEYGRALWTSAFSASSIVALGIINNSTNELLTSHTTLLLTAALVLLGTIPAIVLFAKAVRYEREALTKASMRYAFIGSVIALLVGASSIGIAVSGLDRVGTPSTLTWMFLAGIVASVAVLLSQARERVQYDKDEPVRIPMLPREAQKIERGHAKTVPVASLALGSIILVTDGETIPVDGTILEGSGFIDENPLTGASQPVNKLPRSKVFAGSVIQSGRFLITVNAIGENTVFSQFLATPADTLDATLLSRAQTTVHAIGAGGSIAGVVLGIVLATTGLTSITYALATISVASTGVAATAIQASRLSERSVRSVVARTGARTRTADALERLAACDTIVVEKTGVLTKGELAVESVVSFKPYTQQQVLNLAAAVCVHSRTARARAIVAFARAMGALSLQQATDVTEGEGQRMSGIVSGKRILVATLAEVERDSVTIPEDASRTALEGKSVLVVAQEGDAIGFVALGDDTREETAATIATLKHSRSVIMLTSEHASTAQAHANEIGIETVIADIPHERKRDELARLRDEGKRVVLVALTPREGAYASIVLFRGTLDGPLDGDIIVRHDDFSVIAGVFSALDTEQVKYHSQARKARLLAGAVLLVASAAPFLAWIIALKKE